MKNKKVRRRPVADDAGNIYASITEAAQAIGLRTAGVKFLADDQKRHYTGVRFRYLNEAWREEISGRERVARTRKESPYRHSENTKEKLRQARKGIIIAPLARIRAAEATRRGVVGTCVATGTDTHWESQIAAAKAVRPDNWSTATAQINKAVHGVKKSAYGYVWRAA